MKLKIKRRKTSWVAIGIDGIGNAEFYFFLNASEDQREEKEDGD